jgi:hypothetical protein
MAFPKNINELCTPARVYFVISMIGIVMSIIQNFGNHGVYAMGSYSCSVPSTFLVFFIQIIYILFWSWVLNLICKDGQTGIAWFLVLLPFVLFFVLIGLMMMMQRNMGLRRREGFGMDRQRKRDRIYN